MEKFLSQLTDNFALFPNVELAWTEPDGLLAVGGDLSPERVLNAYRSGIFPWFSEDDPILWWSPSERATINAGDVHISKSMKRLINKNLMDVTINHCFREVIEACAAPRASDSETWITEEMMAAYCNLHELGFAHSIEIWHEDRLVGGLYGICIGQIFFGESMFSQRDNSSKLAFIALHQHFKAMGGVLIECQMVTNHLKSLGVSAIERPKFMMELTKLKKYSLDKNGWNKQSIQVISTI